MKTSLLSSGYPYVHQLPPRKHLKVQAARTCSSIQCPRQKLGVRSPAPTRHQAFYLPNVSPVHSGVSISTTITVQATAPWPGCLELLISLFPPLCSTNHLFILQAAACQIFRNHTAHCATLCLYLSMAPHSLRRWVKLTFVTYKVVPLTISQSPPATSVFHFPSITSSPLFILLLLHNVSYTTNW